MLLIGCDQTSTGLVSIESEEFKYHQNSSNSDIQLTDQTLRIGAEAIKVAIQKPEFLEEVYMGLKFYDKQAHEYDMNRFAAVSIAELGSDDAHHRRRRLCKTPIKAVNFY
ncbi:MAG TPA: hypothetical protein VK040_10420 [Balneolaceae bacterium]|nr:hypothetical protein [Balneolaceae bacterium]